MKRCLLRSPIVLLVGTFFSMQSGAQDADATAIRALQTQQADAWNRHDAAAYADLFTEGGEVVNIQGWWWKGRITIKRKLTDAFAFVFRDSRLTITDIDVRLLNDRFAVAHVRWAMQGARAPPGAPQPPKEGIELQVLRKDHGLWRIDSVQNTNHVPETDFPKDPS
jgi:uncharacterized protein (TIGR02246 family)